MIVARSFNPLTIAIAATFVFANCHLFSQNRVSYGNIEYRLHSSVGGEQKFGRNLKKFRNAEYGDAQTGIFLTEKYDPKRIPVLLVHGLLSSPLTWEELVNRLNLDPDMRNRFQFWYYSHSSASPSVPAAAIMKRHLDSAVSSIEKTYRISMDDRLIVIGHSMGGILSKSLVSSTGNDLWNTAFRAPSSEFQLTPQQRALMELAFRYEPRPYVMSVVFMATPHRGSNLANSLPGRIGMALAKKPLEIENLANAFTGKNRHLLQPKFAAFVEASVNSIATLRPDSPIADVMVNLPVDSSVSFHSIAGCKRMCQEVGDGVVPLSSAIIPGAASNSVIRSDHQVHQTPESARLVTAILKREAGLISEERFRVELQLVAPISSQILKFGKSPTDSHECK